MKLFKDKWNEMNLKAKITEIGEGIMWDVGTFFYKHSPMSDYISFTTKITKSKSKLKEFDINLKGPSFNEQIDEILAKIKPKKPAVQDNTSKTGTQITTTNIPGEPGISTVEF